MTDSGAKLPRGRVWKADDIVGGHPALDFVNTVSRHLPEVTGERFRTFDDLLTWGVAAGVLTQGEAEGLAERAAHAPLEGAAVLGQARELRAIANRIYVALARHETPDPAWVRAFDDALRTLIGGVHVEWRDGAFAWRPGDPHALDVVVRRVAWLTAQFLTSADLTHFRRCDGEDCAWFFLDTTRNHSRRWCAMSDCGGRAKARRYYRRRQRQEPRGDTA